MNIGIIGAGHIGGSLAKVWSAKGHAVMLGVRDPDSARAQRAEAEVGDRTQFGAPAEAAAFGEVVVVATPWAAVYDFMPTLGSLSGKIIIDATNRFGGPVPEGGLSNAEEIARLAPGAKVVKCFNTMGYETLLDPLFGGQAATAFVAGDDGGAKAAVMRLAADIGLETADAGTLRAARSLEHFVYVWINMTKLYGREIAFRLVRR